MLDNTNTSTSNNTSTVLIIINNNVHSKGIHGLLIWYDDVGDVVGVFVSKEQESWVYNSKERERERERECVSEWIDECDCTCHVTQVIAGSTVQIWNESLKSIKPHIMIK